MSTVTRPTSVLLIRHGETVDARLGRYHGATDVPLAPAGRAQIERLAMSPLWEQGLGGQPVEAVYASALTRAWESAVILARAVGLYPRKVPDLAERRFGNWEGRTLAEITRDDPGALAAWAHDPAGFRPPGGESVADLAARVRPIWQDLVAAHPGGRLAIVSHGGVIRVLLADLLGLPLANLLRLRQDFAALSVVELWDEPVLERMNWRP
ncbi:MAG: histidine phosphatase family protein [Thermodesulfobacteriota bacterium]